MHALPLARLGFRVLAVDTCEVLLDTLRVQRGALPIDIVHDELQSFARFIPIRGDAERIHTCFLEYAGARVIVHDLLHELDDGEWKLRVSAYPKLRIAPEWVAAVLRAHGFEVETGGIASGMVQLVARRH